MKKLDKIISAAALAILAWSPAMAQTSDETSGDQQASAERIDPRAMEIVTASARFLSGQKSMAFDWFVSSDDVIDGREIITSVRSGSNTLIRGVGFLSRAEDGDKLREYYYDGKTFTVVAPEEGFYSAAMFDGGFEKLLVAARERANTDLPLWSVMSETLGENAASNIEGAAYLGTTMIAGDEVHHLAFSEYDEDWQIWISTDPERPVPLMIIGTDPYRQGWPQYRAHLMNWQFDVEAPEGGFAYAPGEDEVSVTMPALVPTEREKQIGGARSGRGADSQGSGSDEERDE